MNLIELESISREKFSITYNFKIDDNLKIFFVPNKKYTITYDVDISEVPESILCVPFVLNLLPLAWLTKSTIKINSLDLDFYKSIPKFKSGFQRMYPRLDLSSTKDLFVENIIKNEKHSFGSTSPLAFFSGGVDAHNTLINHLSENPILVTILGSDIPTNNLESWNDLTKQLVYIRNKFHAQTLTIKSTFREIISGKINRIASHYSSSFWYGFQCGIGIIGHVAPLAWALNSSKVYIASSCSAKDPFEDQCGSYPSIDNNVRFCGTKVIHDGYEMNRLDKIVNIVNFSRQTGIDLFLRVCWESASASNCCHCEKCLRTIIGIISTGADPEKYGFVSHNKLSNHLKNFKSTLIESIFTEPGLMYPWKELQDSIKEKHNILLKYPELIWLTSINLDKVYRLSLIKSKKVKKLILMLVKYRLISI